MALLHARLLALTIGSAMGLSSFASSDSLFHAGDYAGYLQAQLQALEQAERADDPVARAQAVRRVGRAHYYLKDKDEARRWMLRAASLALSLIHI